jgi:hypothetical protein
MRNRPARAFGAVALLCVLVSNDKIADGSETSPVSSPFPTRTPDEAVWGPRDERARSEQSCAAHCTFNPDRRWPSPVQVCLLSR